MSPTCSTSPRWWRAACRSRRRRSSSWSTALHPTPAVNGWPRDLAYDWIEAHEGFDRGRYAGAVGWVDARGNGTWAVSIRCADVSGPTARLVRRQRHRGRLRPRHRAGRDPGQAPSHPQRPDPRRWPTPCVCAQTRPELRTCVRTDPVISLGRGGGRRWWGPTPGGRRRGRRRDRRTDQAHRRGRLDGVPHDLVGGAVRVHDERPDAPRHRQLMGGPRRRRHGEDRAGRAEPADHAGGAARVGAGDDRGQLGVDRGSPGGRGDGRP